MEYSPNGLSYTKHHEGLRLRSYRDEGGVWTIGYGHTGDVDVGPGLQITEAHAEQLLVHDVQVAVNAVNELVTIELNQNEFDALVDFVFNIGVEAFKESTILKMINNGDLDHDGDLDDDAAIVASAQFDRWVYVNSKKSKGQIRRRDNNKALFEKPIGDENERVA